MRILAHHAHVFPETLRPEGSFDRLERLLDACGIDEVVCFAPFPDQMPPGSPAGAANRWLAGEIQARRRYHGFGTIDFLRDDLEDQVRLASDLGLRGLKLHPNAQHFDLLAADPLRVYAAAERAGMFVTFHSGVHHGRLRDYDVRKFDEVAHACPDLRFSLEHLGGYHFFPEALAVVLNNIPFPPVPGRCGNVFGGLASVFTTGHNRFWYLPPDRLREAFAQVGAAHLIFGLDFPYNLEPETRTALDTLRGLGLSETDLADVLGNTLRRQFGLPEQ